MPPSNSPPAFLRAPPKFSLASRTLELPCSRFSRISASTATYATLCEACLTLLLFTRATSDSLRLPTPGFSNMRGRTATFFSLPTKDSETPKISTLHEVPALLSYTSRTSDERLWSTSARNFLNAAPKNLCEVRVLSFGRGACAHSEATSCDKLSETVLIRVQIANQMRRKPAACAEPRTKGPCTSSTSVTFFIHASNPICGTLPPWTILMRLICIVFCVSVWFFTKMNGILLAMSNSDITIIDDKNLRGIVAARGRISKSMLEDIIDLIELSSPESVAEDDRRIKEADDTGSWIPFEEVKKRAKKTR